MRTPYYREQALEGIAREVITAYDPNLYYGVPRMIPIEDIIEAQGITLEYGKRDRATRTPTGTPACRRLLPCQLRL